MEALHAGLLDLSVVAFAVSSMLSVGFAYTLQEILEPLRNVRGIIRAVVASFVLVPGGLVLKLVDGLENGRPVELRALERRPEH